MLSDLEIIWKNLYPEHTVSILAGKGARNYTNLMSALALNGPGTTRDLAKFVLKNSPTYEYHNKPRDKESRELEHRFWGLLTGNLPKKTGRKKSSETYSGLIANGYAIQSGIITNQKSIAVPLYSLTLKGCFFCLGFTYNKNELKLFIKNAARNHLLFAFLAELLAKTDVNFVNQIIFEPMRNIINKGKIFLDDNITFYFSNFAEAIGNTIYEKLSKIVIDTSKKWEPGILDKNSHFKKFEVLQNLIFFEKNTRSDWSRSIIEFYYRTEEEIEFYLSYCNRRFETSFFYKVMREIHHAYFSTFGFGLPERSHRRLPYSSHTKDLRKLKKRQLSQKLF